MSSTQQILIGATSSATTVDIGDNVAYSCMFDSASSQYLSRTQTTAGTWTLSVWVKRGKITAAMGVLEGAGFLFNAGDTITAGALTTTALFRDPSAWVHVHISNNGLYINGVSYGAVTTGVLTNPDIGRNSTSYFDGYLADLIFLDNDTVAYTSFGRTSSDTGEWVHKTYAGSYTAGSYRLDFANSADLGNDVSGNNNDWTTNGSMSSANQYTDTPTNNFQVFNKLSPVTTSVLSAGNLTCTASTIAIGSFGMSSGKWYWEITSAGATTTVGMYNTAATTTTTVTIGVTKGFRFDADAGTFDWTTDGSGWTSITTGLTAGPYFVYVSTAASAIPTMGNGAKTLSYAIPSGYTRLSTANLTAPTIPKPAAHFNAKLRTGTGASYSVTGELFQPDLVWVKGRSGATDHAMYDAVRGATKDIGSNLATDQTTQATGLTAFNSDGYSAGALAKMNTNSATYIDWMWKEGATAGFDIVQYTGTGSAHTEAHSLGVVPKMVIVHAITTAGADQNWPVYHANLTSAAYWFPLNTSTVEASDSTMWNSTAPTSAVFSVGTNAATNTSGDTYIAYLFSDVNGMQKIGTYTGNGSADGPFVFTGFKPRMIWVKRISGAGSQTKILDAARDTYNLANKEVYASLANAEDTGANITADFLSNGFKVRSTDGEGNAAATPYAYLAIAEAPLKYSTAR